MKKESKNICKTSRKERHKKFSKFKDRLHSIWGTPSFTGLGNGKPNICSICKKHVYKTKAIYDNIKQEWVFYCDDCKT